ncbi:MAG: hypothetical protein ACK5TH_15285 [Prosthecobacter sp.]|jgi:hypothetical protein
MPDDKDIPLAAIAVEEPEEAPNAKLPRRPNRFVVLWRKIGAGSLGFSLLLHAGILLFMASYFIVRQISDKQVDFLPGGGTQQGAEASADLAEKVAVKQRQKISKVLPLQRVVVENINSDVTLPDMPMDALNLPDVGSMMGGGKLGSGGFGSGGAGGGFGNGFGKGGMGGMTFKPIFMFGMELRDVKKIAVVMDVSRSMTRYLPIVTKELDKVAFGSNLVLYFGCGLTPESKKEKIDDKPYLTSREEFATYWQVWEGKTPLNMPMEDRKKLKYDPAAPMPLKDIYEMMSKRKNTWYIDFCGITHAWTALMSKEVEEADAIYWFADFQDKVTEEMMDKVLKRLKARKQKLYIHASVKGRSFEQVRDGLVIPSGGEVIETELPKK